MRLKDMSAIITGGTRGLGRAIAEAYLAEGAFVVCAARNPYDIEELANGYRDRFLFYKADVTDEASIAGLITASLQASGCIDILVNNAGISRDRTIRNLSLDDWNATITTNLTSTFLCTRAVIDPMSERGGGRIINISSAIATRPAFGAAAYSASKAAVEMFTRTSAVELRSKRINVNNLAPGIVNAGMGPDLVANPRAWDAYRPRLLAGRLGRPEEIGAAAVFLASAESSYINGTTIEVNGGWT